MNPIPTPTPFAYQVIDHGINLNAADYRIWSFADDAINVWNYNPVVGQVLQAAIMLVIVIAFLSIVKNELQSLSESD